MAFTLTIDTDNDAFTGEGTDASAEVAFILSGVRFRVREGETSGVIRDSNGNSVGEFKFDLYGD